MSSEMRDLAARREAGALDGAHQHVERLLVGVEGRPVAAFVGDALQLARARPGARRRRDRPRAVMSSASAKLSAPAAIDHEILDVDAARRHARRRRRSGFPAAAGGRVCRLAEIVPERHARARRPRHARPPSRPRSSRCRRGATCSACRRARSARRRSPPGRRRRRRASAAAISPLIACDRAGHVEAAEALRRRRADRPPRPSRSRRRPARWRGRARRPRAMTSASTVGRPRESQTRRPWTVAMCGHVAAHSMPSSARPGVADLGEPVRRRRDQRDRDATHDARLSRSVGDVLDRRLAVDPREQQAGQQTRGARFDRVARLPGRRRRDRLAPSASKQARKRAAAGGCHRHLSSRWLRQKARSKAGSPYQAHSASRNTGPRRPDQDVLRADVAVHQRQLGGERRARQRH